MDVLVNATTLVVGGGIQVAASFITEAESASADIVWHYAVSPQVASELESLGVRPDNLILFAESPAQNKSQRQRLLELEQSVQPAVVFTVFGPAYVKFSAPHLCGVAVGWVTHSTRLAYSTVADWKSRLRIFLKSVYKGWWLRQADQWVVEAENARAGMQRRLRIPASKVTVVPNSCAAVFNAAGLPPAVRPQSTDKLKLVYVSAYYPHKHLEFVPAVAAALKRQMPAQDFEFVLTLPEGEESTVRILQNARALGVAAHVTNAGKLSLHAVIDVYRDAHICFMPSLLETFSATYPEAMALGRPIVAADLDFARVVCQDAAEYYSATDADDAARAILRLLDSEDTWQSRLRAGTRVLDALPSAHQKYELYVEAIRATAAAE